MGAQLESVLECHYFQKPFPVKMLLNNCFIQMTRCTERQTNRNSLLLLAILLR